MKIPAVEDDVDRPDPTACPARRRASRPGRRARLLRPGAPTRRLALGAGGLLLVLIGGLRLYVGDHWASDVAGGWLFGAAGLLALVADHRRSPCAPRGPPRAGAAHRP